MPIQEEYRNRIIDTSDTEPVVTSREVANDTGFRDTRFALVYYVLNVVEVLLLLRLMLKLLGANAAAGFTNAIYNITNPLVSGFRGIFPTASASGSVLEWSTIIAMIVYALIAYGIVQLLRIATRRTHTI